MRRLSRWLLSRPLFRSSESHQLKTQAKRFLPKVESFEERVVPTGRPLPYPVIAVAPGEGAGLVRLFDADTSAPLLNLLPFEEKFHGGIRVALGDFTRDGYPEVVTAAGKGGGPRVHIFNGKTGEQISGPLGDFYAYDPSFNGGIFVAAGDITGDRIADLVTTADVGGGPHVRVFDGKTGNELASFFAFEESFRGGANVAVGDITGDGLADLILGAGVGGSSRIRVLDGQTFEPIVGPIADFYAFGINNRDGVNVAVGDVNGDGHLDIVAAPGRDHAPIVKVFDGLTGDLIWNQKVFEFENDNGVRVGTAYIDDDVFADIVVGTGRGATPRVRSFSGETGQLLTGPVGDFDPGVGSKWGGVNIAAGNDPPPDVTLGGSDVIDEEYGDTSTFLVTRDPLGDLSSPLTINYTISGTATNGVDYNSISTSVTIEADLDYAYIDITAIDDSEVEGQETVTLTLVASSEYTITAGGPVTITIEDDELPSKPRLMAPIPEVCPPGVVCAPSGAAGVDVAAPSTSSYPVRYNDGVAVITASDLNSDAWGQIRSWSNGSNYSNNAQIGNGWVVGFQPRLVKVESELILIPDATTAYYYDGQGSPDSNGNYESYAPRFFDQATIKYDDSDDTFSFLPKSGEILEFNGFSGPRPKPERGMLISRIDASGTSTEVVAVDSDGRPTEVERAITTGSTTITESYVSTYLPSGNPNAGQVWTVTLRRKVNSGSWETVRKVEYDYYTSGESGGSLGDLRRATVTDSSSAVIEQSYYRYYTSNTSIGYVGGMKYVFGPESYAALKAFVGGTDADVIAASDNTIAPYLDNYFEYEDIARRVTKEIAAGAGCSACSAGQGEYTYSYTQSYNGEDFNSWEMKTIETLPDGTTNTVYTNVYGQVMLKVHTDSSNLKWSTFYRYDSDGRVILKANPSAVTGYNDTYSDLVNYVSSNAQYLSDSDGLITTYSYASTTTATESGAGLVDGYRTSSAIRHGETGTDLPQESWSYFQRTVGDSVISPLATYTVYRNTNGTGDQTTNYAYTWFSGEQQAQSITTTLPIVTTAQNGPNAATSTVTVNDSIGRMIWSKDADGFLNYFEYDDATGALVKMITDVDHTETGDFANLPSGWTTPSGGGLHLITTYEVDNLGRVTKSTAPNGRVDYTVYNDANHEVRYYPGWISGSNIPTGPITVSRDDRANGYSETLAMSATPTVSSGRPTGTESISSVESLSRSYRNKAGQVTHSDMYFDLTGVTYSTAANIGTLNTNYYRTTTDYGKQGGQVNRQVSAAGTITRTEHDSLGRAISIWVGTDDTPTTGNWSPTNLTGTNMTKVAEYEYDVGGVGDSNLTSVTQIPGGGAADRVTETYYDWRNRPVATKSGVETSESTSVNRPIQYVDYDNLNQVVTTRMFDGDAVTITYTDDVPDAPSSSLLRAKSTSSFDELGRAYLTEVYSVDPSSGSVGAYTLASNTWFDRRGQVIKTSSPGGLVQKMTYDGVGRTTVSYTTDGGGDSGWSDADDVTGDKVLTQDEMAYDPSGLVLVATHRDRFHDATDTGALGNPSSTSGTAKARVSYMGFYYDAGDRTTDSVDVGTNGGSAWTLPGSVPSRSDSILVSSTSFDTAGFIFETTDPKGIVARTYYDDLGRTTKTIENYVDGTVGDDNDKTTEYTYGPAGMTSLTAKLTGGGGQTTEWVYGVTSVIISNDIVGATKWPDPSSGSASSGEQETVLVNALGQPLVTTDRNGTVHTLTYDILGRVTVDTVTTLGSGVDGSVRRVETAYDSQGNAYLLTTFDATTSGNIVTQVQRAFNGLGQMTREWQSHGGAVNTSTTPSVQYAYSEMPSGANHSRLTSITYPNGFVLTYNYASGLNGDISRLSSLSDMGGTLESYDYLGLGTVVRRSHPQPDIDLTFLGTGPGSGGDQYVGLDSFGRVIDQHWKTTSATTDQFTYTYDRNSNRLTKGNSVDSDFDEVYTYDNLNQLTSFDRNTGDRTQAWDYDALGNFDSVTTDGGSAVTRTHNKQNEITAVSGATSPTFDANGNMTTDETGKQYVYDAWNRLKVVKDSGGSTLKTYVYDALNRRVAETAGGATTEFYYSVDWQVLEERDTARTNDTKTRYVWSPVYVDAMVLRDRDTADDGTLEERLWVQQDANFNVTALVDDNGDVVERYVYDPFGVATVLDETWSVIGSSSYGWQYLHQGGRLDATSGLYHFRYRDFSSSLGRAITMDPIYYSSSDNNFFRWLANNPVFYNDSTGLDITLEEGGNGSSPVTNKWHMQVCVNNIPGRDGDVTVCFSFKWTFLPGLWIGNTWLGMKSTTCCALTGIVYTVPPVKGAAVIKRKKTTREQDHAFFNKMFSMLNTMDGYSLLRHSCRHFSTAMFDQAPGTLQETPSTPAPRPGEYHPSTNIPNVTGNWERDLDRSLPGSIWKAGPKW